RVRDALGLREHLFVDANTRPYAAAGNHRGGYRLPAASRRRSVLPLQPGICRSREQGHVGFAQCDEDRGVTKAIRYALPVALGMAVLAAWELFVRVYDIPRFVLPPPSEIWSALLADFPSLMASLWTTLRITLIAFMLAVVSGVALAVLFSQSRVVEMMLYPYAVALQVTPVVAIAPLIIIWVGFERINLALLILAW